jgi:ArsR family transcriptional regulator, arsenate/arsenite/antimonite-responsive transcriptional repressor
VKLNEAIQSLAALAQETRLAIFRALIQAGGDGLPAGRIAEAVGAPPSTLSFHLKELAGAGLVKSRHEGRFIYYTADYAAMSELVSFLTEKCCHGMPAPQVARIGQAVASCGPAGPSQKQQRSAG